MDRLSATVGWRILKWVVAFLDYWTAICSEIVGAIGLLITVTMVAAEVLFRLAEAQGELTDNERHGDIVGQVAGLSRAMSSTTPRTAFRLWTRRN